MNQRGVNRGGFFVAQFLRQPRFSLFLGFLGFDFINVISLHRHVS